VNGNKTYCILAHGKSLEELEKRIEKFKNIDVVWCGINYFNPSQNILKKISKDFNIVFDCSTVKNAIYYEKEVRIPRLSEYLEKNTHNKYICTKSDKNNLHNLRNEIKVDFNEKYKNQIIYVEDLDINPNPFCVSLHLYIASLAKLGAKQIVLFGADGGGNLGNSVESYYNYREIENDKIKAGNTSYNMVGDSNNINSTFEILMTKTLGYIPNVINCSPDSVYTIFKKVNYEEVLNYL
jgi:hypothetical protein